MKKKNTSYLSKQYYKARSTTDSTYYQRLNWLQYGVWSHPDVILSTKRLILKILFRVGEIPFFSSPVVPRLVEAAKQPRYSAAFNDSQTNVLDNRTDSLNSQPD